MRGRAQSQADEGDPVLAIGLLSHTAVSRLAFALVFCLLASHAHAQTRSASDLSLEELLNLPVTTVSRTTESAAEAPGRVEVVTASQIERRGYRSLMELLRDVPGMKVDFAVDQDLSADVTVQGTRGALRLVVLMDGVRVTSPTNEAMPILANYPIHNARQVEIVFGPASALYGADAFSGVVNIISKDGAETGGIRASTSVGQWGLTNTQASFGTRLGGFAHLTMDAQFLYDRQPDLSKYYPEDFGDMASHRTGTFETIFGPMTAGTPVSPDYQIPLRGSSFHARLQAGPLQAWVFGNDVRMSNTPAYTPNNAIYNDIAYQENDVLVATVSYRADTRRVSTTTAVTVSRHELDPDSGYANVFSNMQRSYKYAYGSMARAEHQASWKAASQLSITAGATYEHLFAIPQTADLNSPISNRNVSGTILGTPIVDQLVKLRYSNIGAYLQGQWSISPRIALTVGSRGDYNTRYEPVVNPRLGLVTRVTSTTTAKVMFGTAYLAPSPYEAYSHYGSFYSTDDGATYQSDFWHVANPDLKPQHKRTVEAQVQQAIGPKVTVTASGFRSSLTDLVLASDVTSRLSGTYLGHPVSYLEHAINAGHAVTYGGTLTADLVQALGRGGQLHLRGSLSLAEGRVDNADAPGGRIESGGFSPVLGQVIGDIDWGAWSAAPRLIVVGTQRALAVDTESTSEWQRRTINGYATMDVTVRRKGIAGPLDVFMMVENLFDSRYRGLNLRAFASPEEFIGSPQNPRRISAGVQVRFP